MKRKKIVIIAILLATFTFQIPTVALTEKEEFELYKEFKKNKEKNSKKQPEKNNNQTSPVNININNNNNNSSDKNDKSSNSFLVYEQQKKSTVVGGLWSFFIPSAGHLYAQNWIRGSIFLALRVGSLLLMPESSYTQTQRTNYKNSYYGNEYYTYTDYEYDESKAQMITICAYVYWLTTIFEIYDATKQVEKYNEKLIKNLNLGVSIRQNKPVYALTYKF